MLAKNIGLTERRLATRYRRSFSVVIGDVVHEGVDMSSSGFSISTSDRYIHFLMKQRLRGITVQSGDVEYEIALAEVRSNRQKSGLVVYGVKILQMGYNDKLLHEKVVSQPIQQVEPAGRIRSTVATKPKEVLSELILACESQMFDDCEFRSLALNQLRLLKKLI